MSNVDVGREIRAGVVEYASIPDRASRTSVRARVLGHIDRLSLGTGAVQVRSVDVDELTRDSAIRGAVIMHLDLASRAAITSSEILYTATHGHVLLAEHPDLEGFPVGVGLVLPAPRRVKGRKVLFAGGDDQAEALVVYALATNPGGLGAGARLMEAARARAGDRPLVAYAPLTGLRARIIQVVDDDATFAAVETQLGTDPAAILRRQLTDLLARTMLPDLVDEPAGPYLEGEAAAFAADDSYSVGRFHRHLGAELGGVDPGGDASDCDAMWARAYFDYPASA